MSALIYLAADVSLPTVENPHERLVSVKEALELCLEVPAFLLEDDSIDKDKPMILWTDREDALDTDTGSVWDGDLDDDFSIVPMEKQEDIYSEKHYCARLAWSRYTKGRAGRLILYIRQLLEHTPSVEIWHIWMGASYPPPNIKRKKIQAKELTEEIIEKLDAEAVFETAPLARTGAAFSDWGVENEDLAVGIQYCYEIVT